jgi:hypothetical protein
MFNLKKEDNMDKEKKERDMDKDEKNRPSKGEKGDRYEIERGNEPHKDKDFPDEKEDQTR